MLLRSRIARHLRLASLVGLVLGAAAGAGCDGPSEFVPQERDAGFIDGDVITAADIGTPCAYDFADPAADNPSNQCKNGMSCLIVTRDAVITSGLELPGWDDQFTTYGDVDDRGFCTLQGTFAAPPTCPAGTELKLLFPDVAVCVKQCNAPADCGRGDYTCDVRFFDTDSSLCVRKCTLDVPDCVRSAMIQEPQSGQIIPALAFQDLAGDSQCNVDDGRCEFVQEHGVAGPGEPCLRTEDCEGGAVCLQAPLLGALLGFDDVDLDGPGFCASTCTPSADPDPAAQQSNCSVGFVCQASGNLNINFQLIGGPFVADLQSGGIDARGGLCFHQCQLGIESTCAPFPGTECGSLDEGAAAAGWNGVPQCLPDPLRL